MKRDLFTAAAIMMQRWREEPLWSLTGMVDPPDWPRGSRAMPDGGWECGDELSGEFSTRERTPDGSP